MAVYEDSTERKKAELALLDLNRDLEARVARRTRELEAANEEMEAFTYSVSHDLRAPLRSIDGFSRILLQEYTAALDEQGRHYLERVCAGSERMGTLINDLLQLSRSTRGVMRDERVDLSELCRELMARMQRQMPERRVVISIEPGMQCRGDSHLLKVAFENLLGNAWKYTSNREEARIEVRRVEDETTESGFITLCIRDNGAGFDMTYAQDLFAPFRRLHLPEEYEGSGVGLATVKRIVRRHGGLVRGEGEVDKGAAFYVTLPMEEA